MASDPRRTLGARGERVAEAHLAASGYRVLERNYRTRFGEIDLVLGDARGLVFCEVKTRSGRGVAGGLAPLDSIGVGKRRRVRMMAREWLAERPARSRPPAGDELRFDAIGVRLSAGGKVLSLEHVEDAF